MRRVAEPDRGPPKVEENEDGTFTVLGRRYRNRESAEAFLRMVQRPAA